MSASAPSRDAQVVAPGFAARWHLRMTVLLAAATLLLFLAFRLFFAGPLPATYAGVYFALRDLAANYLFPIIAVTVVAFSLLVGAGAVFLCGRALHKIAGPLYRLERALDGFDAGEPVKAVFLRHGDELEPLAAAYNGFTARLRADRQRCTALMEHAERLCLQDAAVCRAEMGSALDELSALLSKYR